MYLTSPDPKAQVGFSDQKLYVVRRLLRIFFLFSSYSPKPLAQFQTNKEITKHIADIFTRTTGAISSQISTNHR